MTIDNGVKIVTINDSESLKFSVQHLLEAKEIYGNSSDSFQLHITHSHITIAAAQNEYVDRNKYKSCIKLIKVPIVA